MHLALFFRGFLLVALTAMNVGQIASQHYGGAFLAGCAISLVWFGNSHCAAHSAARFGRECYALGAGCGTMAGMLFVRWFYG